MDKLDFSKLKENTTHGDFILPFSIYKGTLSPSFPSIAAHWHEEIELLSEKDLMEEFMFLGLRLKKGISEQEFKDKFGKTVGEVYQKVLSRLTEEGVLEQKNGRVSLSEKGTDVANYVMAEFLLD